jgi:hypothetical protein
MQLQQAHYILEIVYAARNCSFAWRYHARRQRQNFLTNWTNKQQDKKANDSGKRSIGKA